MNSRSMFHGTKPKVLENAGLLRNHMTDARKKYGQHLKIKLYSVTDFKNQHPIGCNKVDYYCYYRECPVILSS